MVKQCGGPVTSVPSARARKNYEFTTVANRSSASSIRKKECENICVSASGAGILTCSRPSCQITEFGCVSVWRGEVSPLVRAAASRTHPSQRNPGSATPPHAAAPGRLCPPSFRHRLPRVWAGWRASAPSSLRSRPSARWPTRKPHAPLRPAQSIADDPPGRALVSRNAPAKAVTQRADLRPARVCRSVAQPPRISGEASRWPIWKVPPR
jgi:hypothetical protein